jgi:CheY-like chemotaxis protein
VKSGKKYDMILLDHMMPELDGIETLHKIKKLEDYDIPPIIAVTANAITGMKEMYLKEGFDEYLSKPINISQLDKIINKYFNKGDENNG